MLNRYEKVLVEELGGSASQDILQEDDEILVEALRRTLGDELDRLGIDPVKVVREMKRRFAKLCPRCKSSDIMKYGKRTTSAGTIQKYRCRKCGKYFSDRTTYFNVEVKKAAAERGVRLRRLGLSLRKIRDLLEEEFGVKISHVTVMYWIREYENSQTSDRASDG